MARYLIGSVLRYDPGLKKSVQTSTDAGLRASSSLIMCSIDSPVSTMSSTMIT